MSSVSAFYWFLKCTSPGASGGFAPLTPTGALPLDPTRGPWAGPWTPGRKALATLACSLRIAESDFWDFNVGRYVKFFIGHMLLPMNVVHCPQHPCVAVIQVPFYFTTTTKWLWKCYFSDDLKKVLKFDLSSSCPWQLHKKGYNHQKCNTFRKLSNLPVMYR